MKYHAPPFQGRSWYTKWLTVVERSPVVTRFDTREFLDIGGFVNIPLRMDDNKMNGYMYQVSIIMSLRKGPHGLVIGQ